MLTESVDVQRALLTSIVTLLSNQYKW